MIEQGEGPAEPPRSRGGLLMLAAVAIIAVPVIVGLIVIRSDSPSTRAPVESDMGSGTVATSAGDTAEPPAPNVAVGAAVSAVSSEFSDAFAASNAVDGSGATEWSSAGDGDDAFIEIDLGDVYAIEGVGFRTRSMTDGTAVTTSFTITVDGTTYGPFDAGPGLSIGLVEFEGRIIRFDVATSTGGNTGAIEVEVYGSVVEGDDTDDDGM